MYIRDFLDYRVFSPNPDADPWIHIDTDPLYQTAYVVGEGGKPVRLNSVATIKVPMLVWLPEEENDLIFRAMSEASNENLRTVQTFKDLTMAFWAKCSKNLHALVTHPSNEGRFQLPPRTTMFYTAEVPENRLVGVGAREMAGIYLVRGDARGFVAKRKQGLLSIVVNQP